jgi:hypothetical protein
MNKGIRAMSNVFNFPKKPPARRVRISELNEGGRPGENERSYHLVVAGKGEIILTPRELEELFHEAREMHWQDVEVPF